MRGVVFGGTSSGTGKTVATLAAATALRSAGYTVQPAKAGPDFIDPSHHAQVTDRPSRTLDPWLQGVDGLRRNYHRGDGDICLVEGMMGLYDGSVASTAHVAEGLELPVVLVVDAGAGMQSVGATALGFREYATEAGYDIELEGVIAQQAHGGRHADGIREALPDGIAYLGRIPPDDRLEIPDRHLGLKMGGEAALPTTALTDAATHIDAERLAGMARIPPAGPEPNVGPAIDARIAVASGPAFAFRYPATLERLRERATVQCFDPVAGDPLPACKGVYVPGGYPELHASDLAAADALDTLATRAMEGLPVYGECGGLMALGETLTVDGESHRMAGVLPVATRMCDRYQALDHVELEARTDTLTATAGDRLRGHEFHYSAPEVAEDARFAFDVIRGDGIVDGAEGLIEHATLGTYCHVHAESGAFDAFLDRACAATRR